MTSDEGIKKYKEIYRQQTGVELTDEEAAEQATRLLNLYRVIRGPMPKTWLPRYLELLEEHTKKHGTQKTQKL